MAIFNRCSCATHNNSRAKKCKACGSKLGKNYYIQYSVDGKRKTEKIGDSIGFAKEVLAKRQTEVKEGKYFGNIKSIHWKDYFETHYRKYCEKNLKSFCLSRFDSARDFKPFQKAMNKISRTDIESYREHIDNGKRSKATLNRYMQVVKFAFNYAESLELIDRNPARRLSMYKEEPRERRAITREHEQKLLNASKLSKSPLLYHFIMVSLYTGMRYSETLNVKWSHVSREERSIIVQTSKNNESREIPMSKDLLPVVEDLFSITGKYEYIFSHPESGEKINYIKRSFRTAVKNADIGYYCIHELRHSYITRLAASSASITEIQQISGHKTAKMVQRYTHLGLKEARRTIDRFDEHRQSKHES